MNYYKMITNRDK